MSKHGADVSAFGAKGDGIADDYPAIQAALDSGEPSIYIPAGEYLLGGVLKIRSDTKLTAHAAAHLTLADGVCTARGDAMLRNADPEGGNENICVTGGIWNGNNPGNRRPEGLFGDGYTGSMFRFINVKGLRLSSITMIDSEAYYLMLGELDDFTVENITFRVNNLRPNQDGVHLGGFCRNGTVCDITGIGPATNDDLIALNADDNVERYTNLGLKRGDIENVTISNVSSDSCHTLVRLLSVTSRIANVTIDGVYGGCRCCALNMDSARYCLTPLFDDRTTSDVGAVENVTINDMRVYKSAENSNPLIMFECDADKFRLTGFHRDLSRDMAPNSPTLSLAKLRDSSVSLRGVPEELLELTQASIEGGLLRGDSDELTLKVTPKSRVTAPGDGLTELTCMAED